MSYLASRNVQCLASQSRDVVGRKSPRVVCGTPVIIFAALPTLYPLFACPMINFDNIIILLSESFGSTFYPGKVIKAGHSRAHYSSLGRRRLCVLNVVRRPTDDKVRSIYRGKRHAPVAFEFNSNFISIGASFYSIEGLCPHLESAFHIV